jgi:hypothetical protein
MLEQVARTARKPERTDETSVKPTAVKAPDETATVNNSVVTVVNPYDSSDALKTVANPEDSTLKTQSRDTT